MKKSEMRRRRKEMTGQKSQRMTSQPGKLTMGVKNSNLGVREKRRKRKEKKRERKRKRK
jgi:hypothetical protein